MKKLIVFVTSLLMAIIICLVYLPELIYSLQHYNSWQFMANILAYLCISFVISCVLYFVIKFKALNDLAQNVVAYFMTILIGCLVGFFSYFIMNGNDRYCYYNGYLIHVEGGKCNLCDRHGRTLIESLSHDTRYASTYGKAVDKNGKNLLLQFYAETIKIDGEDHTLHHVIAYDANSYFPVIRAVYETRREQYSEINLLEIMEGSLNLIISPIGGDNSYLRSVKYTELYDYEVHVVR